MVSERNVQVQGRRNKYNSDKAFRRKIYSWGFSRESNAQSVRFPLLLLVVVDCVEWYVRRPYERLTDIQDRILSHFSKIDPQRYTTKGDIVTFMHVSSMTPIIRPRSV